MDIRVIGLRDRKRPEETVINTTSKGEHWTRDLSPFHLGPCPLYGGRAARRMENAWQYAKVYGRHADLDRNPTPEYWAWAKAGWSNPTPIRYPMGKGAKPLYSYWDGEKLGYIDARLQIYWALYRDAVAKTAGYRELLKAAAAGPIALWDFDGYDHEAQDMSLAEVLLNDKRPMGHAFVLMAMLLYGPDVDAKTVLASTPAVEKRQRSLI